MIIELLENLFNWGGSRSSRTQAKNRLRLVIAHDRAGLSPAMIESMRQDIIEVVSRYVDLDPEQMEFSLESDQRVTALIANLPIRGVKRKQQLEKGERKNV